MSVEFACGFDFMDDSNKITGFSGSSFSGCDVIAGAGKYGGNAIRIVDGFVYFLSGATISNRWRILQGWVKFSAFSDARYIAKLETYTNHCCGIKTSSSQDVSVYDASGTLQGTSDPNIFTADTYHYLEVKFFGNDTTGACQVRVDNAVVLNVSNIDTIDGNPVRWRVRSPGSGCTATWDDMIAIMGWPPGPTDWLGKKRIYNLLPTADGDISEWTRSAGSDDYVLLNDPIPGYQNGDTGYISTDQIDKTTRVDMQQLPGYVTDVDAVIYVAAAKDTDPSGSPEPYFSLKKGSSVAEVELTAIGAGWYQECGVINQDPDSLSWSPAAVNSLLAGVASKS